MDTCQNIAPSPFILAENTSIDTMSHLYWHWKDASSKANCVICHDHCHYQPRASRSSWFGKFEIMVRCVISLVLHLLTSHANVCVPFSLELWLDCNVSKCYVVDNCHNSPKHLKHPLQMLGIWTWLRDLRYELFPISGRFLITPYWLLMPAITVNSHKCAPLFLSSISMIYSLTLRW